MSMIVGIVIAIVKATAIVGAGLAGGAIAIVVVAILAAPMGGWKLVRERWITVAGIAVAGS